MAPIFTDMSVLKKLMSISWTSVFSGLSTFAVRFVLLALFAFLMVVIARGLKEEGYKVQQFQVPKNLSDAGYNGQVVALLLQDEVHELKVLANSRREDSLDLNVELRPDLNLEVMGVGLSASSMIFHLRDLLGRKTYSIGGNITDMDNVLTMNLRMTGYDPKVVEVPFEDNERSRALKELVNAGAMYVLKKTDPYRLSVVHYRKSEIAKAEDLIRDIITNRPQDRKWAYHFWGNIMDEKGEKDKAQRFFNKALEEDPNFVLPRRMLGWAHFRKQEYVLAIEQFEKALAINPLEPNLHNGLAICHRELGDLTKATEQYEIQLKKFPEVIWTYANYSEFLIRYKKDTIAAAEIWKQASEHIDESGDYYAAIGAYHLMKKDTVRALESAMQALDLEPDNVSVLSQLSAFNYFQLKDYAQAEHYYRRQAHALATKNYELGMQVGAYNMLAMSEYHQSKYDSAFVHARKAIELIPTSAIPWSTVAELYLVTGDLPNFYESIEEAIRLGFLLEQYLDEDPYNLIKDQSRLRRLISQHNEEYALKG